MKQIEPSLPVFWAHGTADTEVPASYGEEAISFLNSYLKIPADKIIFKTYEGLQHTVNDAVMADLAAWLDNTLA